MLSKLTPGRTVSNAIILVLAVLLLAALADYVGSWMGFRLRLECAIIPTLINLCWTAAIIMAFAGALIYAFRRSGTGAALFLTGLFIGVLPLLANGYLVRLLGIGCAR